ncbi:hypothetical protein AMECASPLE_039236 [Ameca splendens]|uniref:Alkylated DNA repair protein AlkB homologue 8 N-terminal domain-containing protein n=1 Tax=Ameca splendens TaxID=208324 RepID=A0ABV0YVK9_9TELE
MLVLVELVGHMTRGWPHHPQQHCVYCGSIALSRNHTFSGHEVIVTHRHCLQEGLAATVLPVELKKHNHPPKLLVIFYTAIIQSVLGSSFPSPRTYKSSVCRSHTSWTQTVTTETVSSPRLSP